MSFCLSVCPSVCPPNPRSDERSEGVFLRSEARECTASKAGRVLRAKRVSEIRAKQECVLRAKRVGYYE